MSIWYKIAKKIASGGVAICIALLLFCPKPLEMTYYVRIRFWRAILNKAIVKSDYIKKRFWKFIKKLLNDTILSL